MKRILFIMLSALIMTACGSSNSDKEQARRMLAAEAIATNNQLQGMQIDFATKSDGCEFKDDIFHYYYTVYEEYVTIEALEACKDEIEVFIIGGASLYKEAMSVADRLYITEIDDSEKDADAFFPEISLDVWEEKSRECHSTDEKHLY